MTTVRDTRAQAPDVYAEIQRILYCIEDNSSHYAVLNLNPDATITEIHRAYGKAVNNLHPLRRSDLIDSDPSMKVRLSKVFTRTLEAYTTLSNIGRRIEYDNLRNRRPVAPLPALVELRVPDGIEQVKREALPNQTTYKSEKARLACAFGNTPFKAPAGYDRRREARFALRLPVRILCAKDRWREVSKTIDVSQHGVRFRIAHSIIEGRKVRVELPMPVDLRADRSREYMYVIRAVVRNVIADGAESVVGAEFIMDALQNPVLHSA